MKKLQKTVAIVLLAICSFSSICVLADSQPDPDTTKFGYRISDFENYDVDTELFSGNGYVKSSDELLYAQYISGSTSYQVINEDGNKVMKLSELTSDTATSKKLYFNALPDTSNMSGADYYVLSYKMRNGDADGTNAFRDFVQSRQFRGVDGKLYYKGLVSADIHGNANSGTVKYNVGEYNQYTFIGNVAAKQTDIYINGTYITTTAPTSMFNDAGSFFSVQFMNDSYAIGNVYVDDIETYALKAPAYNIVCDYNGRIDIESSDEIRLTITGTVDADTLQGITVSNNNGNVPIESITYENGVCTIKLVSAMDEFTTYTVDTSSVKNPLGFSKSFSISFTTTGEVELTSSVTLKKVDVTEKSEVTKLSKGVIGVETSITNKTPVTAKLCVVALLKKSGVTEGVSYKNIQISLNESEKLISEFKIPDNDYQIEVFVKDNLNGTRYFTPVYVIDSTGITSSVRENISGDYPSLEFNDTTTNEVRFYDLKFGESGARNEISAVKAGLVDCEVILSSDEQINATLIVVVKKDNKLTSVSSITETVNAESACALRSSVSVPDAECAVETYVWSNLAGTQEYLAKAVLPVATEE